MAYVSWILGIVSHTVDLVGVWAWQCGKNLTHWHCPLWKLEAQREESSQRKSNLCCWIVRSSQSLPTRSGLLTLWNKKRDCFSHSFVFFHQQSTSLPLPFWMPCSDGGWKSLSLLYWKKNKKKKKKNLKVRSGKKLQTTTGPKQKKQRNAWQNALWQIFFFSSFFVSSIFLVLCKSILGKLCVKKAVRFQVHDT